MTVGEFVIDTAALLSAALVLGTLLALWFSPLTRGVAVAAMAMLIAALFIAGVIWKQDSRMPRREPARLSSDAPSPALPPRQP